MGTRASVIFIEKGKPMFAMYRQFDGYLEGLGQELKDIVKAGKVVNGLGSDHRTLGNFFNGAGCLFATVIAKLKTQPGNVYICRVEDVGRQGEDFVYTMDEFGEVASRKTNYEISHK